MQFSDPHASLSDSPYDSPYGGNAGMPYMGRQPRSFRRGGGGRGGRWYLGCLGVILLILALLGFGFNWLFHWGPTMIQVGPNPTLVIESISNPHSEIFVHVGGKDGQIMIQPVRQFNLPFGLAESYQKTTDSLNVIYNLGTNVSGLFDITVPAHTNLKIDSNDAGVMVDGITGQMDLATNGGTLIVRNSTVVGPSLLRSNSGEIQASQDHLSGHVTLDNNSADSAFQGSLDPAGSYRFTNNSGSIALTLPQSIALQINASTISGSIKSSISGVKAQPAASGFTLQANLGSAPRAQLTLGSNSGNIIINEQGGLS
ncbi:MAG TPA: hypothetical protein VGD98_21350 [Ktedonobacteraceae bacterium]